MFVNNQPPQLTVVANNINTAYSSSYANASSFGGGRQKNKWVAFFLCLFLEYLGAHKFY